MSIEKSFDTFSEARDFAKILATQSVRHTIKSFSEHYVVTYDGDVGELQHAYTVKKPTTIYSSKKDNEKVFLSKRGVTVTNLRLTATNMSFSMDDVTGVEVGKYSNRMVLPIVFLSAGIWIVYTLGLIAIIFPASIFFILALFSYNFIIYTYQVKIATIKGKVVVLSDNNHEWVKLVVAAIEKALNYKP